MKNNIECKVQLLDLYFSKFSFVQKERSDNSEYTSSFKIGYSTNKNDKTQVKITIDSFIKNKDEKLVVDLQTIGIFKIDSDGIDLDEYNQLIKANTVAIIFPYIRSQISLITTQPGVTPIMIPPINFSSLAES